MPPVFIFADQVLAVVRAGEGEIQIPEGARISSAAADLIKAHQLKIVPAKIVPAVSSAAPEEATRADTDRTEPKTADPAAEETSPGDAPEKTEPVDPSAFSDEQLEEIVDRVIERFRQLKSTGSAGGTAVKPGQASVPEAAEPAEADDLVICRCEEITRSEIKAAIRNGMHTLNGIKRVTRAGMGLCQGQTCQQLVARILTEELGLAPADIDPTTARGPVRPLSLSVFANS